MALDTDTLQAAIKAAFKKSKDTPAPSDPAQADAVQEKILTTLAEDLAAAVEAFVKGGDVANVTVQVKDLGNNVIGNGAQTGFGIVQ